MAEQLSGLAEEKQFQLEVAPLPPPLFIAQSNPRPVEKKFLLLLLPPFVRVRETCCIGRLARRQSPLIRALVRTSGTGKGHNSTRPQRVISLPPPQKKMARVRGSALTHTVDLKTKVALPTIPSLWREAGYPVLIVPGPPGTCPPETFCRPGDSVPVSSSSVTRINPGRVRFSGRRGRNSLSLGGAAHVSSRQSLSRQ